MKMIINKGLPILVALSLCLFLPSCQNNQGGKSGLGETAIELEKEYNGDHSELLSLKIVVNDTYCLQTACECVHYLASREYYDLIKILKKDYNIDLDLVYCIDEFYLEDSIKTNNFDGAICKPWFFHQFEKEMDIKPKRVVDILDPFENAFLAGAFIVRNESHITKPSDINGLKVVTGEANSYEKYHSAKHLMEKEGIVPGEIKEVSACSEGINALLDREAEVAVISDYALVASCAVDLAEEDAFRTVWQTEDMPLCSLILDLNKVKEDDAARIQAALLEISENNIPKSFASKGFIKPMPWTPNPYIDK